MKKLLIIIFKSALLNAMDDITLASFFLFSSFPNSFFLSILRLAITKRFLNKAL